MWHFLWAIDPKVTCVPACVNINTNTLTVKCEGIKKASCWFVNEFDVSWSSRFLKSITRRIRSSFLDRFTWNLSRFVQLRYKNKRKMHCSKSTAENFSKVEIIYIGSVLACTNVPNLEIFCPDGRSKPGFGVAQSRVIRVMSVSSSLFLIPLQLPCWAGWPPPVSQLLCVGCEQVHGKNNCFEKQAKREMVLRHLLFEDWSIQKSHTNQLSFVQQKIAKYGTQEKDQQALVLCAPNAFLQNDIGTKIFASHIAPDIGFSPFVCREKRNSKTIQDALLTWKQRPSSSSQLVSF